MMIALLEAGADSEGKDVDLTCSAKDYASNVGRTVEKWKARYVTEIAAIPCPWFPK